MQLFVSDYIHQGTTITISNLELLSQVRKVLRAKIGDIFYIQSPTEEQEKTRFEVRIDTWDNKEIKGTILSEHTHELAAQQIKMIVAMPNKWDKAELIAQKLSEIGVSDIIFWPSERSIIREWNPKKEERIKKIIQEAVEQSRGRRLPKIHFAATLDDHIKHTEVIIFDKQDNYFERSEIGKNIVGVIGPEGGFTKKDYKVFAKNNPQIVGLGETVLRMETAAIIGARLINNDRF